MVECANVECRRNDIYRNISDGNVWSTLVNTKSDVNIELMIALRVSPAETQVDGLPPASSSDPDVTFPIYFVLGGKLSNLFSPSIFFPAKLDMYLGCPEFLGHLVVAVQRSSQEKFFRMKKFT